MQNTLPMGTPLILSRHALGPAFSGYQLGTSRICSIAEAQARQLLCEEAPMQGMYELDLGRGVQHLGSFPEGTTLDDKEAKALLGQLDRISQYPFQAGERIKYDGLTALDQLHQGESDTSLLYDPRGLLCESLRQTDDGFLYKLTLQQKSYMLKVFKPNGTRIQSVHGCLPEISTAIYLTAQGAGDCAKFIAANPSKKWMLTEFIDANTRYNHSQRGTTTLAQIAEDANLYVTSRTNQNHVSNIWVDFAGILPQSEAIRRGFCADATEAAQSRRNAVLPAS